MSLCARAAVCATMACLMASSALAQTQIADATGRTLTIPDHIGKVYAAGPPASVFVLALAPEKLAGWTRAPRIDEIPFLPSEVARLPDLGRLTGRGNTVNAEAVMAAKPDLIVDIGRPLMSRWRNAYSRRPAFPTCCSTARCAIRRVSCASSDESSTPVPPANCLLAISKRR